MATSRDEKVMLEFHTVDFGVVGQNTVNYKVQHMTKSQLLAIHKMQLSRNENNIKNTDKLVTCFGGIDNMLTLILSSQDIEIENNQISEIHKIITRTSSNEYEDDITERKINKISNNDDHEQHEEHEHAAWCTYYFDTNMTYLHTLFGDNNAEYMLSKYIYSIYSHIINLLIISLICMTLPQLPIIKGSMPWIIIRIIAGFWGLIFLTLTLLSANKKCFVLIKSQFEFLFKLVYMLQRSALFLIYNYYIQPVTAESNVFIGFLLLKDILIEYCYIILLIIISSIDAFKDKLFMKLIAGIALAALFTKDAIYYGFYAYIDDEEHRDHSVINMKYIGSVSIIALYGATSQILAIFVWKQMINLIIKRGKCKLIKHSPDIKWILVIDKQKNDKAKQVDDDVDCGCFGE